MCMTRFGARFLAVLLAAWFSSETPARASEAARRRAACAQLKLSMALGDEVSPSALADCSDEVSSDVKQERAFQDPVSRAGAVAHDAPPEWVGRIPRKKGRLYGVGHGPDLKQAFRDAIEVIAAQLEVEIQGDTRSTVSQDTEAAIRGGREVGSRTRMSAHARSTSRMIVRGVLEDVALEDQYRENDVLVHVLAMLDLDALRAREDALVASALHALAEGTERLTEQLSDGERIEQSALLALIATIDDVAAMGRSKLGRKVRDRWRSPLRVFKRLVERALRCVEVDLRLLEGNKAKPIAGRKSLPDRSRLRATFTCRGKPIADGRIRIVILEGIVGLDDTLVTDHSGNGDFAVRDLRGKGLVRLGFRHALEDVPGAQWIGRSKPAGTAVVEIPTSRSARFSLEVTGLAGQARTRAKHALESFVTQKWGAELANRSDADFSLTMNVALSPPQQVQGRVSQSVEATILVQGPSGKVFDERLRAGTVAKSNNEARERALSNLMRKISKLD